MPKPTYRQRSAAPAHDQVCCWPNCNTAAIDWPICNRHAVKTYSMVRNTLDAALWHREYPEPPTRQGFVYFIRYRDRVKIGYSINPRDRITAHPHDAILAIVPGTPADERRCHAAFTHLRDQGEWFTAAPDLLAFAEQLGIAA